MNQKKSITSLPVFWTLLKKSGRRLENNDPLRMAGATAFFTTFALPPIIVLIFQVFSIFFSRQMVGSGLGEVLSASLGPDGARQLRETARGFRNLTQTWYMAGIGFIFLIFVATTLFKVIRNTFHDIWDIRRGQVGFLYDLKARLRSLAIILSAAVLFLAAAVIDLIRAFTGRYLQKILNTGNGFFSGVLNEAVSVGVVTIWFIVLFRYLANARPSWRVAVAGGILTGILFSLGKAAISTIFRYTNAGAVYGAGGAIALILLFVFYASFLLYFGASFVKEYSVLTGDEIVFPKRMV